MSTNLVSERLPWESHEPVAEIFKAQGFPPGHPAEPDLFVRQKDVPGYGEVDISRANVVMVGAGGIGSWAGLALVRSGVKKLTIIDPDRFDRTNAHRQLMFAEDLGCYKALSVARNLVPHMIAGGRISAINLPFEDAAMLIDLQSSVMLALVDNNQCRLAVSQWARSHAIPAVFVMLSLDGTRVNAFLQGPCPWHACLSCALPNLDAERRAPCAASIITGCLAASTFAVDLTYHALALFEPSDGVGSEMDRFWNWRTIDLMGGEPESIGEIPKRPECLAQALHK